MQVIKFIEEVEQRFCCYNQIMLLRIVIDVRCKLHNLMSFPIRSD